MSDFKIGQKVKVIIDFQQTFKTFHIGDCGIVVGFRSDGVIIEWVRIKEGFEYLHNGDGKSPTGRAYIIWGENKQYLKVENIRGKELIL